MKITKNINRFETRDFWKENKNRLIGKNGEKGTWFYTCKKEGCELPRCLNEKTDPEFESSIKSNFCTLHKKQQQLLEKAAPKAAFEKAAPKAAFEKAAPKL